MLEESVKHFLIVLFCRLREVFLRGEAESICPKDCGQPLVIRAGGWGFKVFGYWT